MPENLIGRLYGWIVRHLPRGFLFRCHVRWMAEEDEPKEL